MHHAVCHCRSSSLVMAGCSGSGSEPAPHETPATVEHPRTEAELSTVKLTPEAVKRLGIETVTVKTEIGCGDPHARRRDCRPRRARRRRHRAGGGHADRRRRRRNRERACAAAID